MKKGIHRIAVPVGRTVQNFCSRRDYRAVVCSQLLSPPPFAKGALAVKVPPHWSLSSPCVPSVVLLCAHLMICVLNQDLPSILPKKGEVVLEVKAAAVNFPDLLIVQGKYQFKVDTKHELSTAISCPVCAPVLSIFSFVFLSRRSQ